MVIKGFVDAGLASNINVTSCSSGLTCQHVSKAVDLSSVKKAVTSSMWSMCSDCLRERTMIDGEPASGHDILICLKCGFQVSLDFEIFYLRWEDEGSVSILMYELLHLTCDSEIKHGLFNL